MIKDIILANIKGGFMARFYNQKWEGFEFKLF